MHRRGSILAAKCSNAANVVEFGWKEVLRVCSSRTGTEMRVLCVVVWLVTSVTCQQYKIVGLFEPEDTELKKAVLDVISQLGTTNVSSLSFKFDSIDAVRDDNTATWQQFCSFTQSNPINAILDFSWDGLPWGNLIPKKYELEYHRVDTTIRPFIKAADDLLRSFNASDAAFIFQSHAELDQGLMHLIGGSFLRFTVLDELDDRAIARLRKMRPTPGYYVIIADGQAAQAYFSKVVEAKLATRDTHWTLVLTDFSYTDSWASNLKLSESLSVSIISPSTTNCCAFLREAHCSACNFKIRTSAAKEAVSLFFAGLKSVLETNKDAAKEPIRISCDLAGFPQDGNNALQTQLSAALDKLRGSYPIVKKGVRNESYPGLNMTIFAASNQAVNTIGYWRSEVGFVNDSKLTIAAPRRIYRVGMILGSPWLYETGKDTNGKTQYGGYCKEMLDKLAEKANFDYDIVLQRDGQYGLKLPNGSWNGLVGELSRGETDMAIAAMTMTTEREEVIDFVTPYFEQSGMSIVIRKPVRDSDMFKFMSVLKWEVWMSMLAALVVTGLLLWVLERLSPYSARNKTYPDECRHFTLQESLWFALTSFTPQGGGEPPKPWSSRILVAAYWLFVMLMLAAFTANLAAFLTVERMLAPVTSLEELARQSQINYSVVNGSSHERYFKNMANAEEELYRVWKEMTLNSSPSEQAKFRVWDYPIKEQYTHIWRVINASGLVSSKEEGFRKVEESTKGEFALIHDASEIKYEVYKNCNLTTIGDPFGEQPYAVAVQQGSSLQAEISRVILVLQKDRYFETLAGRYWNSSRSASCDDDGEESGIDLESLGGVFIAAAIGLGVSVGIMGLEILYYKYPNSCRFFKKLNSDTPRPEKRDWKQSSAANEMLGSAVPWNSSSKVTSNAVTKPEKRAGWR